MKRPAKRASRFAGVGGDLDGVADREVRGRAVRGVRAEGGEEEELERRAPDEGGNVDRGPRPVEEHPVAHPAADREDAPGRAPAARVGWRGARREGGGGHWSASVASRRALASTKPSRTRAAT